MFLRERKSLLLVGLALVILCLFGCFGAKRIIDVTADNQGQLPTRRLRITIEENQREQLFAHFQKFADKHGFEMQTSDYGTDWETYMIWLSRNDIKIIATHNPHDKKIVSVGFYNKNPAQPAAKGVVDALKAELESFLSDIPNITITEEQ